MEFVQGLTLGAKLNSSTPITLETGLNYIKQVLSGLACAHEQGIIHRDVKPSNIMITRDDHVKLLDFGLAFPTLGPEFTRTGTILGSLQYMPPEQVLCKQLDARSDIYSVGVTLYQLLTGRLPFEGASDYDIASGHLRSVPIDPATINRDIPVRLSTIVLKSLAKSPDDRFQTAKEFLQAFDLLRSGDTATLAISTLPTTRTGQARIMQTPEPANGAPASGWPEKKTIDSSILDAVSRDLAYHVGPIAKVIVSRAARQAATLDDLFARVAAEISTEKQRQDFLATRMKHSISK
jgi:serine/threonine-protein kinase